MTEEEFSAKYPCLGNALYDFHFHEGRTDEEIAERQLRNEGKNSLDHRIYDVSGIVDDCRRLLKDFDADATAFSDIANRRNLRPPEAARAWVEKMIPVWRRVLDQLMAEEEGEFRKKYPNLALIHHDFEYTDNRTDEDIASQQLRNEGRNSMITRIGAVEPLIEESRRLLENFKADGPAFARSMNRAALEDPAAAREWLEKKILPVWVRTLAALRRMKC